MLSPGVKTRELDFSMYASETSTCVVGMIGGAEKGPIGIPMFCANPSDFVRIFGEPTNDEDYGALAALLFLAKGSSLWYVREANEDAEKASATFDGTAEGTPEVPEVPEILGTKQIETLSVAVTSVTAGSINVVVTGALVTGSPKTVAVTVAESDTADMVADAIRTALNLETGITTNYTVTGATNAVILTAKVEAANDINLNIAISTNTKGVTAVPNSTNTLEGVATIPAVPAVPAEPGDPVTDILTVTFKEEGIFGERYSFKITNASGLNFTMTIYDGNYVYEVFQSSVDSTSSKYIADKNSDLFTFAVDIQEAVAITNSDKTALSGGDNGMPLTDEQIVGEGVRGLQAFSNPNNVDISVIAAPGRSDKTVIAALLKICEDRADCFAIIDPPAGLTPTQMAAFHNGTGGEDGNPEAKLDTSYGAIYYPWVKVTHPTTQLNTWVPPSSVVLGAYAVNDNLAAPWVAPAGLTRGKLGQVIESERDLSETETDLLYGNDNAVNPIINYRKQGFVLWGQRTLQREDTALDRVNVRRLLLYVRKLVSVSSSYMVFEQNDSGTWRKWTSMVTPFLDSIQKARGLYDYKVVMDGTTVTPAHIDRNEMPGKVFIKPTKSAEYIVVDFVLTSTGASFA
jgi:phage tail sheath protein FI